MADFPSTSSSLFRSSSTSSGIRRSLSLKRFCRLPSTKTSTVSSSPSPPIGLTSSQTCTPAGSAELASRIALCSQRERRPACVASDGGCSLATIQSGDDQKTLLGQKTGSIFHRSCPSLNILNITVEQTATEEEIATEPTAATLSSIYNQRGRTSTDVFSLTETLTCPSSLETEMNVSAKDHEELRPAIDILSLEPPTITISRGLTLRTMTISRLKFPDTTKRSLDALVTNSFTLSQLPAAREIQRFIQANPDTHLPRFLITSEIAEMYGDYGWCLIGKCGLRRIAYKIAHLMSTDGVTEEELEKDRSRRHIDLLCGHIRDRHFESMLFRCRLCPASYINQDDLNRHWRTHALDEFACPTCGDILISEVSLRVHRHSNETKKDITAKMLHLLPRAIPRLRK